MDAKGFMSIEGGASRFRIFRDQLEIAERGHQGDHERNQEGQPYDPSDLLRNLAREGINSSAENVADDKQQKQPGPHDPMQARLDGAR